MGDLYEECGTGLQEELYEAPQDEPPPKPAYTQPTTRHSQKGGVPRKPARPVTTVIGDTSGHNGQAAPWGVPLRSTGKLDEARAEHRRSIKSMPPAQHKHPTQSASNRPEPSPGVDSGSRLASPPGTVPAGVVAGGFRLPAASFMSANKPNLRKVDRSGDAAANRAAPPKTNVPASKPAPSPKTKPALANKPTSLNPKPGVAVKPPPSSPAGKSHPPPGKQAVLRDSMSLTASTPPLGSPRTPVSPTPGESTMASRFRRCALKTINTQCPPPVPFSTKPPLPQEGQSLASTANSAPSPATPRLADGPLSVPAPGKTGNSPLPPRPEKSSQPSSPMPFRPPKPSESPLPERPTGSKPVAIRRSPSNVSGVKPEMRHSPPTLAPPPPPPPPTTDSDGGFDEVADDEEDMYMPPMDEAKPSAPDDLADDVDNVLDSIGGSNQPFTPPPPPPPDTEPYPEDDIIEECMYDDVEGMAQEVLANKAREEAALAAQNDMDEPVYEVEQGQGLPPPSDDLYDDVPCGPGGNVEEIEEEISEEEYNEPSGVERSGSFSDIVGESTDEWSAEETLDGDPTPLPGQPGAPVNQTGSAPPDGTKKRKLSKRTKKRIKDEEKQKVIDEKKAKEDAKKREREEKEAAKQREKEARENKRKEVERKKLVDKQRKHFKITDAHKPHFVAISKNPVIKAPNHYLIYNSGDRFNVLFHQPDKQHKLPNNSWLVERQLDEQVGYVMVFNMQVEQQSAEGEEIPAESMYEDVGQGSAIAAAAFSAPQGLGQNLPPPSVRAPPVPASIPTEDEECLYEDLPN